MTTLLLILSLLGPIDRERFLAAISEVESGNNPRAIGKSHERTQWQIAPVSFKDIPGTGNPAHEHLRIQLTRMSKGHVPETVENVALVWRRGFEGAKRRRWKSEDYCKRVFNLYNLRRSAGMEITVPKPIGAGRRDDLK